MYLAVFWMLYIIGVNGQLRWERLDQGSGEAPSPRRDMGFGYDVIRDQIIVFGGNPGPLKDTWIYNVQSGQWRMVAVTKQPEARFSMVSGVSGDFFYIATGEGENDKFFSDIWRFDLRNERWEELPVQNRPDYYSQVEWTARNSTWFRPEPRYAAVGGIYPNGGEDFFVSLGFSSERFFNTYTYNTRQLIWKEEHCQDCHPYDPSYPHARCLHAGTVIGPDELVIFGGCLGGGGTGGPCPAGDSWHYNNQMKTWTRLPDCASARIYGTMASLPNAYNRRRVVLYGGMEKNKQVIETDMIADDEIAVYDPDSTSWTRRKTLAANPNGTFPEGRASVGMATAKNGIFMFGGVSKSSSKTLNDLWLLKGTILDADESEVIKCGSHFINYITVHGILMTLGWGFFLQWGAFIARYLRSKNPLWFYLHVSFQVFGLCCATAGFVFAVLSVPFDHIKFVHAIIGLVVGTLGALQPINALVRPHPAKAGETKSFRRRLWECVHNFGGRAALILALINISLGVFLAVAPRLIWALWFGYMGFIVLMYILAESCRGLRGRKRGDTSGSGRSSRKTKYMLEEKEVEHD